MIHSWISKLAQRNWTTLMNSTAWCYHRSIDRISALTDCHARCVVMIAMKKPDTGSIYSQSWQWAITCELLIRWADSKSGSKLRMRSMWERLIMHYLKGKSSRSTEKFWSFSSAWNRLWQVLMNDTQISNSTKIIRSLFPLKPQSSANLSLTAVKAHLLSIVTLLMSKMLT